ATETSSAAARTCTGGPSAPPSTSPSRSTVPRGSRNCTSRPSSSTTRWRERWRRSKASVRVRLVSPASVSRRSKVSTAAPIASSGAHFLQQAHQVVGVLLFHGQDALQHAPGGGILAAQVGDHLPVAVDGNALGDQVLADHVDQVLALDVFGMAAGGQAFRGEIGLTAELDDALGDL